MYKTDETHRYDDIIDMPHHVSAKRKQMDPAMRAAQFSPFAALTGFENYISEEGRFTDCRAELDEEEKNAIGARLSSLASEYPNSCEVVVTYYSEDSKKAGGKYLTVSGKIEKIDSEKGTVTFEDGFSVLVSDVFSVSDFGKMPGEA